MINLFEFPQINIPQIIIFLTKFYSTRFALCTLHLSMNSYGGVEFYIIQLKKYFQTCDIEAIRQMKESVSAQSQYHNLLAAAQRFVDFCYNRIVYEWTPHASMGKFATLSQIKNLFDLGQNTKLFHLQNLFAARRFYFGGEERNEIWGCEKFCAELTEELKQHVTQILGELKSQLSSKTKMKGDELKQQQSSEVGFTLDHLLSSYCTGSLFRDPWIVDKLLQDYSITKEDSNYGKQWYVSILQRLARGQIEVLEFDTIQQSNYARYLQFLRVLLTHFCRVFNAQSIGRIPDKEFASTVQQTFFDAFVYTLGPTQNATDATSTMSVGLQDARRFNKVSCTRERLNELVQLFVEYGASVEKLCSSYNFLKMISTKSTAADFNPSNHSNPSSYYFLDAPHFRWMVENSNIWQDSVLVQQVADQSCDVLALLLEYGADAEKLTPPTSPIFDVLQQYSVTKGKVLYAMRRQSVTDKINASCGDSFICTGQSSNGDTATNKFTHRVGLLPPLIQLSVDYLL